MGGRGSPDDLRQRVERELKALLVDQPPDEQHEPLARLGEARAQRDEVVDGVQVAAVDAVGDHRDARLVDREDVGDVAAHVVRAGDDAVRAAGHPRLDAVDVGLRVLVDPALVAAVLGRVDRREVRAAQARRRARAAAPATSQSWPWTRSKRSRFAELAAGGVHVRVHALDPGDEGVEVARHRRPRARGARRRRRPSPTTARHVAPAARQHVDLDAGAHERLRQLADVPREPACDDRRVLPRQDEDTRAQGRAILPGPAGIAARLPRGGVRCAIYVAHPARSSRDLHVTTAHHRPRLPRPDRLRGRPRTSCSTATGRRRAARRGRRAPPNRAADAPAAGRTAARAVDAEPLALPRRPAQPRPDRRLGRRRLARGARSASPTRPTPARTAARRAGARTPAASAGTPARSTRRSPASYALHFESAHYRAQVYVDGSSLRRHTGAYEPFIARARAARRPPHGRGARRLARPAAPGRRGLAARVVQLRRPAPAGDARAARARASSAR